MGHLANCFKRIGRMSINTSSTAGKLCLAILAAIAINLLIISMAHLLGHHDVFPKLMGSADALAWMSLAFCMIILVSLVAGFASNSSSDEFTVWHPSESRLLPDPHRIPQGPEPRGSFYHSEGGPFKGPGKGPGCGGKTP